MDKNSDHSNPSSQLSLEQEFDIASFKQQVAHMSREQAQEFLLKLYRMMIIRESLYKEMMKRGW